MPTRTRLEIEGPCLAFVTTTIVDWVPAFAEHDLAEIALKTFRDGLAIQKVSCLAYVLMPSHLHAVIGVPDYPLVSKFMQSFKILSSKRAKELMNADLFIVSLRLSALVYGQYDRYIVLQGA